MQMDEWYQRRLGTSTLQINLKFAFNSRIAFCLNMHNKAVRVVRYPSDSHEEKESAKKRRERQQQEQEVAKHIVEEDDSEF